MSVCVCVSVCVFWGDALQPPFVSYEFVLVQIVPQWYVAVGVAICMTILINTFVPHISPLLSAYAQLLTRGCTR